MLFELFQDAGGAGVVQTITAGPGITVTDTDPANPQVEIAAATMALITGALQAGNNVSLLTNDAGYITSLARPVTVWNNGATLLVSTLTPERIVLQDAASIGQSVSFTGAQGLPVGFHFTLRANAPGVYTGPYAILGMTQLSGKAQTNIPLANFTPDGYSVVDFYKVTTSNEWVAVGDFQIVP